MALKSSDIAFQDDEIRLLLEGIRFRYGYDFHSYAEATIHRRIMRNMALSGYSSLAELRRHVLKDKTCFESLFHDLSINVTDMFRDPRFYQAFRNHVIPDLRQLPFINIWHAGCASGEEVYSLAIIIHEEGLDRKTRVLATDFNEKILAAAEKGRYPLGKMKAYAANYHQAGGKSPFGDYFAVSQDHAAIHGFLKKNVVFRHHNLVSGGPLEGMHLILCRNVLIYFKRDLQNRVFQLFSDSLVSGGYLGLGTRESLRYAPCAGDFQPVVSREKIYRKKQ